MAGFYSLENKEVIRIKVKKCDGMMQPEYKKFSIDPQITSFEMLQGILAKAFEIKSDFTLSYLAKDAEGQEVYLSMLSDWDMDAAFQCAADPCLKLKVDLKPFDQELDDWDVIAPADIPQARISSLLDKNSLLGAITSNITSHVGKTMSTVQKAMGLKQNDDPFKPLKPPMSDMEFHNYLDSAGFMVKPSEFRLSIYQGGIEGSLRRVAWRHLLNIFPENMSGRERFDYLKRKEQEYYSLRDEWKERFAGGSTTEEVKHVAGMVKKDVLRTDRGHRLYAGGDDNKNVLSLFHILVTYALTHPDVSYCQGMSDLASPLLVIQKDEAQAYICFCSLMSRIRGNFSPDGSAMMTQFRHLALLLQVHDAPFYEYLQSINAHDLFFCYRWLLLLLKREFPFEDALYMLEVMWSTLPPAPPEHDLSLVDVDYNVKLLSASPCSPTFSFQHSVYAKLLAMRCSNKARDFATPAATNPGNVPPSTLGPVHANPSQAMTFDVSPADEDRDRGLDYPQIDDIMTQSLKQRSTSIDQVLQADCGTLTTTNSLTVPSQDFHCPRKAGSPKHVCSPARQANCVSADNELAAEVSAENRTGEDGEVSPSDANSESCDTLVEESMPAQAVDIPGQNEDAVNCESLVALERQCDYKDGSVDTNSSYANISVELGTADDGSVTTDTMERRESLQGADREMQFSLSLDSNPSSPEADRDGQSRKEGSGEDEGYAGFFGSMKKLLSSPKRRPENIVIKREISSYHNTNSYSTSQLQDMRGVEETLRRVHSDSGVSEGNMDGEGSSSWSGSHVTQPSKPPRPSPPIILPPPQEFGNGNPFLMFLCLTLMLQHREQIIRMRMDYEEVAQFFNKMVRRHNVHKVLHQARELYTDYLRSQQHIAEHKATVGEEDGLSC